MEFTFESPGIYRTDNGGQKKKAKWLSNSYKTFFTDERSWGEEKEEKGEKRWKNLAGEYLNNILT